MKASKKVTQFDPEKRFASEGQPVARNISYLIRNGGKVVQS